MAAQPPPGTHGLMGWTWPKLSAFTSEPVLCFAMLGHSPLEREEVLESSPEAKPTILPCPLNGMITRKFFELKEVFSLKQ